MRSILQPELTHFTKWGPSKPLWAEMYLGETVGHVPQAGPHNPSQSFLVQVLPGSWGSAVVSRDSSLFLWRLPASQAKVESRTG